MQNNLNFKSKIYIHFFSNLQLNVKKHVFVNKIFAIIEINNLENK